MSYVDDMSDFTHALMEGVLGKKSMLFESRGGKPETVVSAYKYKNFALVPSENGLKLYMEKDAKCEKTGQVQKVEFKKIDENHHTALIETENSRYTLLGLGNIQKMSLEGSYNLYKQTEMLKETIKASQGVINRTIRAIDERNEKEYTELRYCRDQLDTVNSRLSKHTNYDVNMQNDRGPDSKVTSQEKAQGNQDNDMKSVARKIEAGIASTQEIQQYNKFQEDLMKQSMSKAQIEVSEIKVEKTMEIIR